MGALKYIQPTIKLIQGVGAFPTDWTSQPLVETWIDGYKSPEAQIISMAVGDLAKSKAGVVLESDSTVNLEAEAVVAGAKPDEIGLVVAMALAFEQAGNQTKVLGAPNLAALAPKAINWDRLKAIFEAILLVISMLK